MTVGDQAPLVPMFRADRRMNLDDQLGYGERVRGRLSLHGSWARLHARDTADEQLAMTWIAAQKLRCSTSTAAQTGPAPSSTCASG
jgi:hypothetical protein